MQTSRLTRDACVPLRMTSSAGHLPGPEGLSGPGVGLVVPARARAGLRGSQVVCRHVRAASLPRAPASVCAAACRDWNAGTYSSVDELGHRAPPTQARGLLVGAQGPGGSPALEAWPEVLRSSVWGPPQSPPAARWGVRAPRAGRNEAGEGTTGKAVGTEFWSRRRGTPCRAGRGGGVRPQGLQAGAAPAPGDVPGSRAAEGARPWVCAREGSARTCGKVINRAHELWRPGLEVSVIPAAWRAGTSLPIIDEDAEAQRRLVTSVRSHSCGCREPAVRGGPSPPQIPPLVRPQ